MVTLKDLLDIKFATTSLHITARDPESLRLEYQFLIGPKAFELTHGIPGFRNAWASNGLTYANRSINVHNSETGRGPEMAWGVIYKKIAPELLNAEVFNFYYTESPTNGINFDVELLMPAMQVEAVKAFYEREENE